MSAGGLRPIRRGFRWCRSRARLWAACFAGAIGLAALFAAQRGPEFNSASHPENQARAEHIRDAQAGASLIAPPGVIGYWRFEDGEAGAPLEKSISDYNSPALDALKFEARLPETPLHFAAYSREIPAASIFDPVTGTSRPNRLSLKCQGESAQVYVRGEKLLNHENCTIEFFVRMDESAWTSPVRRLAGPGWTIMYRDTDENFAALICPESRRADSSLSLTGRPRSAEIGRWYHLALVFAKVNEGCLAVLYQDYQPIARAVLAIPPSFHEGPLHFGIPVTGEGVLHLDEIRFSAAALSPEQFLRSTERFGGLGRSRWLLIGNGNLERESTYQQTQPH